MGGKKKKKKKKKKRSPQLTVSSFDPTVAVSVVTDDDDVEAIVHVVVIILQFRPLRVESRSVTIICRMKWIESATNRQQAPSLRNNIYSRPFCHP